MEEQAPRIKRAMLVYQAGIANLFWVTSFNLASYGREEMTMPLCPKCGKYFRTLEDEQHDHPCPYCGYHPDLEPDEDDDDPDRAPPRGP